jgi:hypothetical protein
MGYCRQGGWVLALLLLASVCHAQRLPIRIGASRSFAVWSSTNKSSNVTLTNGNLTFTGIAGNNGIGIATVGKSSGKWYWEITVDSAAAGGNEFAGVTNVVPVSGNTSRLGLVANSIAYRQNSGGTSYCYLVWVGGSFTTQGTGCTTDIVKNDVLSFALDMDALSFTMYLNGNIINTAVAGLPAGTWYPACQSDGLRGSGTANFGQNSWSGTTASLRSTLSGLGYNIGLTQ